MSEEEQSAWYLVRSKPYKEHLVCEQLRAKSSETYHPTVRVNPVNPRNGKIRPVFPGYVFVRVDGLIGADAIRWLPGVKYLVPNGSDPISISNTIIKELKRCIAEIKTAKPLDIQQQCGGLMKVNDGPLAGRESVFDVQVSSQERIMMLLGAVENCKGKRETQGSLIRGL